MKRTLGATLGVVIFVLLGVGSYAYVYLTVPGTAPIAVTTTPVTLSSPGGTDYDCAKPSLNSQNFCDKLPPGYEIPPRLPNSPPAGCRAGMTDSACALLKQTYGNGVCDPNETVWTNPFDCGCPGALVGDPYTGRCGSPASICQVQEQPGAKGA